MSDSAADAALKAAIDKPEDERSDADWELLANAFESDKSHLAEAAHETGHDLAE
jgi:hypothetical protein